MRLAARYGNNRISPGRSRGTVRLAGRWGWVVLVALLAGPSTGAAQEHVLPFFTPAGDVQQGFARIINHSHRAGTVRIHATDDDGRSFGPVVLSLNARQTRHFNSGDLERGNSAKGLSGRLGNGEGYWRLRLESDLDLEVGAYIRTPDGFLSSVHDVVPTVEVAGEAVHRVSIFNPGSNRNQVSWLRLVNLTRGRVSVTIQGRDDEGRAAPGGEVSLTLPAAGARHVSAQQLESGATGLIGRLGDGKGKWQLFVRADGDIEVGNGMQTPSGHLTNLSVSGLRDTGASEPESPRAVGSTFRDCAQCPEMVVVPAGRYAMGSPAGETDRDRDESPAHRVTIDEPFAVGVHEVTFAQWDACHEAGGCAHRPDDQGWGRGNRPVVDVSWHDAQEYVRWLSGRTGRWYRLLSESQWEYVARAGTTTRYWWGDDIGRNRANCEGCGSRWDARQTAPVGSFSPNAFGLHDVHGNVWEWVEDCYDNNFYVGAPSDGSAWVWGGCDRRGIRGGSWESLPRYLRAANRGAHPSGNRLFSGAASVSLRVAGTLATPARHTLALFRPPGQGQQGFARIINRSNRAGTVRLWGTDDSGNRRGPVSLSLDAGATRHFNSEDLEQGNAAKGLSGRLGNGQGDWRLELASDLDLEPSAYIRTPDGFLTAMHAVARRAEVGGETVHQVPIFNPGSNRHQVSWLRVANLGDTSTRVTIRGQDDAGRSAPSGEVRLTLPAHGARRISAQALESGAAGLSGRLGEGTGKWQLSVTADAEIEVVSLLASPTGHLSNLSTTPGGAVEASGFEVVAEGSTTVRPLQTIALSVPAGLGESDYTVLMDLSGTGAFTDDETIEVEGLTTDDDRILFASPLTQMLSDANTSHRLAVRVRRDSDRALSAAMRFSIDDIALASEPAGFPTTLLDVIMKAIYTSADDPLLQLAGASMQPGAAVLSARRLGLDTTFSDVQAKAILQYLFGMPVSELVIEPLAPASAATASVLSRKHARIDVRSKSKLQDLCRVAETVFVNAGVCDFFAEIGRCYRTHPWDTEFDQLTYCWGSSKQKLRPKEELSGELVYAAVGGKLAKLFKGAIVSLLRKRTRKLGDDAAQIYNDVSPGMDAVTNEAKMRRALTDTEEPDSSSNRHFGPSGRPTKRGLESNFESQQAISQFWVQKTPELLGQAESQFAGRNLNDEERSAAATYVDEAGRRHREAENIDEYEGVYTRGEDPREALENDSEGGLRVAEACEPEYEEFPIDDETSTCVFRSLVERNRYPGSRPVSIPGVDAWLYYSLDYFRPDGTTCRDNYARVYFQGRWTCRWAELGAHQPAWYTLLKEEDDNELPQWTHHGVSCATVRYETEDDKSCREFNGNRRSLIYFTNNCPHYVDLYVQFSSDCSGVTSVHNADRRLSEGTGTDTFPTHGCFPYTIIRSCAVRSNSEDHVETCGSWIRERSGVSFCPG